MIHLQGWSNGISVSINFCLLCFIVIYPTVVLKAVMSPGIEFVSQGQNTYKVVEASFLETDRV